MKAFRAEIDEKSFLTFTPMQEVNPATPLQFAVIIARYKKGFLLVYNRFRACWELPGGLIDEGETAREAALREFFEETGQSASRDCLLGLLEVSETAKTSTFSGVLCGCEVDLLEPFTPGEEISELALWRGQKQ